MEPKKPDPRERLIWWPKGFCSAWNDKTKTCRCSPCGCVKKLTKGKQ